MQKKPMLTRILVVDADRSSSQRLSAVLRNAGFADVAAVTSGRRAMEEFRKTAPGLVIIDPCMNTDSSYEVVEQLISAANGSGAPRLLFHTADETEGPRVQARLLGARGVLPKPCGPEALLAEVRAALAS